MNAKLDKSIYKLHSFKINLNLKQQELAYHTEYQGNNENIFQKQNT